MFTLSISWLCKIPLWLYPYLIFTPSTKNVLFYSNLSLILFIRDCHKIRKDYVQNLSLVSLVTVILLESAINGLVDMRLAFNSSTLLPSLFVSLSLFLLHASWILWLNTTAALYSCNSQHTLFRVIFLMLTFDEYHCYCQHYHNPLLKYEISLKSCIHFLTTDLLPNVLYTKENIKIKIK